MHPALVVGAVAFAEDAVDLLEGAGAAQLLGVGAGLLEGSLEDRAKLRRAALVEFEVRRRPNHGNGESARACRSSVAAVVVAAHKPDPRSDPGGRR